MLTESLEETFRSQLDALGLELAELRIGGTAQRPLVQVRIEWPPSDPPRPVTVADCARASRALEAWLERPLKWHRHWVRFVGRTITARLEGMGRVRARIVAMPDQATVVLQPEGGAERTVPLA